MQRISLVIPVRNEELSIRDLIQSIEAQTRRPDEVILVDGGSTDRTMALARELTLNDVRYRVIEAGPATPGRGRNVGIAAARNEWVALTDAGIRLEPDWLKALANVAEEVPDAQIVYGNYEADVRSFFEACAELAYVAPKQARPGGEVTRGPSIASCMLQKTVWETVGGFPDTRAAEDLVFMERVEQHGFKIAWARAATVWWRIQPSFVRTFRKFALYSKHNVWAGRQGDWHYGIARNYLVAMPFVILALFHSPWWLITPALGALARVAKSFWVRRKQHSLWRILNPVLFAGVGLVILTIDLATFVGWLQARWSAPPQAVSETSPSQATSV